MKFLEGRKWVAEDIKTWQEEKGNYESSVKPFYLKKWSNWMEDLINKEGCDEYEITMMVYLSLYFLASFLLLSSSIVIRTVSTVSYPF
jgi:hypothetical protein